MLFLRFLILTNIKTNIIEYNFNEIDLNKNSHLEYFIYSSGSKFKKHEINCSLNQKYGSAVINGILNLDKDNKHEIKTVQLTTMKKIVEVIN